MCCWTKVKHLDSERNKKCKLCDFSSHKKSNYQKHLDTKKHQKYEQKENMKKN
jgi:hypothetical protein